MALVSITLSDNFQRAYSYTYNDIGLGWREIGAFYKARHVVDLCNANGIAPETILDCGAGSGSLLKHLSNMEFGSRYYAVDIGDGSINTIRAQGIDGLVEARRFDGYEIPFEDAKFDLVILSHVLEHVEFERLLLRDLKRVAKFQCIEVPIDHTKNVDKYLKHFTSYGHINVYTPPMLRFLLGTEGFEIIDDLPDLVGDGVREYQKFVLKKEPDTPEARAELKEHLASARAEFEKKPRIIQEDCAHNYTVLCRHSGQDIAVSIMHT